MANLFTNRFVTSCLSLKGFFYFSSQDTFFKHVVFFFVFSFESVYNLSMLMLFVLSVGTDLLGFNRLAKPIELTINFALFSNLLSI